MSEETRHRRGRAIAAAVILALIWLPVSPLSLIAFAGFLDCGSGDHLPYPTRHKIVSRYVPCSPWESDVNNFYGTEWHPLERFYHAVGQGQAIQQGYGTLALFDVIVCRMKGERPIAGAHKCRAND
jgi:hypothetical protein